MMVSLLTAIIEGEDDFDCALNLAGSLKNTKPLTAMLRDPGRDLSFIDRVRLADFIEGRYGNGRGRRPAEKRLIGETDPTPVQHAAALVDAAMARRRERGQKVKGELPRVLRTVARLCRVDEDAIVNCRKRSKTRV